MGKPKKKSFNDWLSQRISDFQYDMDQAVAGIGFPTVELEKISQANNTCFWRAKATHTGLEISWGVLGTIGNQRFFSVSECRQGNPALELKERMEKKLKGAYTLKSFNDNF